MKSRSKVVVPLVEMTTSYLPIVVVLPNRELQLRARRVGVPAQPRRFETAHTQELSTDLAIRMGADFQEVTLVAGKKKGPARGQGLKCALGACRERQGGGCKAFGAWGVC